ncbi:FtsX-like permease family protein [Candidatus Chlorohelix sp.]|uniref:ABC transporter permease n=1 Tax=Candidatus Chlorohelix sp. TaxID=3139201 RepID=UPI003024525B
MQTLTLYFKYAWRSIWRGGQRTFFAILCIAVGVAAIVALQTTGQAISDSISGDAKAQAGADVVVTNRQNTFSTEELSKFDALKQAGTILDYTYWIGNGIGITIFKPDGSKSSEFGSFYSSFIIDPTKYPYYGKVDLEAPAGKSLKDVLLKPAQIVINSKMASSINAKVGDKVKATGDLTTEIEVVGILNSKAKSPDNQAEFLGYNYLSNATAKLLFSPENVMPNTVFVKTASNEAADNKARDAVKALSPRFKATTSAEINDQVKQASDGISTLLSYVGLISLLIGSVGVVNTMLVVVGRRSTEIATIKAIGMEAGQTVKIFVIESAILGFIGSFFGIILGELLALITSRAAEGFVNRSLEYRVYLNPIIMGFLVGIITAIVFGLLPAYSASKIPPAQVLRQKTNALPRISIWATIGIILVMTVVMGLMAGVILKGELLQGVLMAFGTLVSCAILILIFSGILWVVGKLPLPFGLNYKMARRNLSRNRAKSAITVLVMLVGIFAMSFVLILAGSLKDTIKATLEKSFGYSLQVQVTNDNQSQAIQKSIENKQVPGLEKQLVFTYAKVQWTSGGNTSADELIAAKVKKDAADETSNQQQGNPFNIGVPDMSLIGGMSTQDLLGLAKLKEGKLYEKDDEVTISNQVQDAFNLKIGDKLVYKDFSGKELSLTITGIFENKSFLVNIGSAVTTYNRVGQLPAHQFQYALTISQGKVDQAEKYFQTTFPGANVTNLSFITNIFNQLLDNFTAFPVLLAFLCLIAGAVLIANNVALAVLDRRTEMGVMKSIGADNNRVLAIINLESIIVGFLGGLFGIILSTTLAIFVVQLFGTADNPAVLDISPFITFGMIGLALVLAVSATIASAWGAAQEKPMVVLRYE